MTQGSGNYGFRRLALLCVAAGILGLLFSGCPTGDPDIPQYTITFESHGGSDVQPIRANKGTAINKPVDPTRTGHTFLDWYDAETGGTAYIWPYTLNADVTMHAQWRPGVSVNISVWINEDGNILTSGNYLTISKSGSAANPASFTATVNSGYSGVQWSVNGVPVDGSRGTAQSIIMNAADYENGPCYLEVQVDKDGVPYSTLIHFTVIN
jgi:hypothetical protein